MKLGLIRHGETVFNRESRMQGVRDIELSERGREQARELGRRLRDSGITPERLYSSPVKRALDTAGLLGLTPKIIPAAGFSARSLGHLEGLTKTEIRKTFPGAFENLVHWDYSPPGAKETLRDLYVRATREIDDLVQKEQQQGLVLAVTHSGVLEALVRGWMNVSPDQELPIPLKNAGVLWFKPVASRPAWELTGSLAVGEEGTLDHA